MYDMESGEMFVSRDVAFSESVFPYLTALSQEPLGVPRLNDTVYVDDETHEVRGSSVSDEPAVAHEESVEDGTEVSRATGDEVVARSETDDENLGRGRRSHRPSVLLKDFVTDSARCGQDPVHAPLDHPTGSSGTCFYPISHSFVYK